MSDCIFAIEGVAESGKTTFVGRLDRNTFGLIPEIFDSVDVPRYNPDDALQRLESDFWFLNVEKQRWRLAAELKNSGRFSAVVMDRCVISQLVHMRARFDVYDQQTNDAVLSELWMSFRNRTVGIPSSVFVFGPLFEHRTLSLDPYQAKPFLARVKELYAMLVSCLNGMSDFSDLRNCRPEELTQHVMDVFQASTGPIPLDAIVDALDLTSCLVKRVAL